MSKNVKGVRSDLPGTAETSRLAPSSASALALQAPAAACRGPFAATADVAIVGAGPAGCAAAIELARAGASVLLLERSAFPRPKVCGEFLSPEVAGVLEKLGCGGVLASAARIDKGRVVTPSGYELDFAFPLPAYGLSRGTLDAALARRACAAGATLIERTEIASVENSVLVGRDGRRFASRAVLLACGRHSLLTPARPGRRDWYGFKAHFQGTWPSQLDLEFFPGGYLGVAPVEGGRINVCALVEKRLLKDPNALLRTVLGGALEKFPRDGEFLFCGPLRPGWQAPFPGALAAGDAAAFVDPFTGDGIALALGSGCLAARHILAQLAGHEPRHAAASYRRDLRRLCRRQLAASRVLQRGAGLPWLEKPLARLVATSPLLRKTLFRITRGGLVASGPIGRQ